MRDRDVEFHADQVVVNLGLKVDKQYSLGDLVLSEKGAGVKIKSAEWAIF
jgi:hypothetical protein